MPALFVSMTRRRIKLLSVAAACLLAVILMGSVWTMYFTGRSAPFEFPGPLLPEPPIGPGVTGTGLGGLSYRPVHVDRDNIQAILATVERPAAYRMTVICTTYWSGGEEIITHHWIRRNGLTRTETAKSGRTPQNRIYTDTYIYEWMGDTIAFHTVSPGDTDAEALSGIPTWETVISLPRSNILHAEYINIPGNRCLLIRTQEPVYRGEYVISLETGLIYRASFFNQDDTLAYEVKVTGIPLTGDPGDGYFTLPDGQLVE
jgi:hypothetical protein